MEVIKMYTYNNTDNNNRFHKSKLKIQDNNHSNNCCGFDCII